MKTLRSLSAFTLIELLVVISIIGILAALSLPAIAGAMTKGQMTQTLNNFKQLHLATTQMALDGTTTGDTNLVWPGDQASPAWNNWATNLVPSYLSTNDFNRLLSAPSVIRGATTAPTTKATAIIVWTVSENSSGDTVFLSTANWTNGTTTLSQSSKPYGNKGFVLFHKGGDGAILLPAQAGQTNITGTLTNAL